MRVFLGVVVWAAAVCCWGAEGGKAAVKARGSVKPAVHPRLFAEARDFEALRARCQSDELCRLGLKKVCAESEKLLKEAPCERKMEGRRLLGTSRKVLERISNLSMAYQLTRDKKYATRAIAEMKAVAAFADWNPSHFLDVAEMTLAFAIGYDWCYDALSEEERALCLKTLVSHAMKPAQKGGWWVNANNNWGQVCHAGILSGAYCLLDSTEVYAQEFTQKAVKGLPRSMASVAPGGNYPEGPSYWHYGMEFNVLALELLARAEGHDFGLSKLPGFEATGEFMNLVTGPSGLPFNFADAGSGRGSCSAAWWFAKRYNRPDIAAYYEAAAYKRYCESNKGGNRLFAFCLLWNYPIPEKCGVKSPLLWNPGGENGIVTQRTSWDNASATFVGLKAGRENTNHAHMDGGAFVLDRWGIRWAYELGMEDYYRIESRKINLWGMKRESERWRILRLGSQGHNTLTLNDELHYPEGEAKVLSAVAGQHGASEARIDLTSFFGTNAQSVVRTSTLHADGSYVLTDEIKAPAGTKVRWQMFTKAEPGAVKGGGLPLSEKERTLTLYTLHNPKTAWGIVKESELRQEFDSPNPGIQRISFEEKVPANGELKLVVQFK